MTVKKHFYDVLEAFVTRGNYKSRQLDDLSAMRFGPHQHIPHETISRWRRGEVKKPRMWQDLVKLAIVLNLTESEADELLTSAKHCPIAVLRKKADDEADEADKALLSFWDKKERQKRPPVPQAPFQAPPDQTDFTGRHVELRTFKEGLRNQVRIFCVQGMAGVGKTTLAIHLAYQLRDDFPDGVLWCQLERSDTMSVLRSFADAYGHDVSVYRDLGSRSSKVRELLAGKRVLMVLDNAEEDEQIRSLLPPTGSCAVIITTRRHDLWVADSAHRIRLEPFSEEKEESLALFARILGEGRAQKQRAELINIADLLGHLPLAIAIAANRMKHEPGWSAEAFLKRVREQKRRLRELKRGDYGVRLSFDFSYHALLPDLQRFFATLGVFEGEDFTVEAAAYVAELVIEDAEDYLRELYSLSLLQLGRDERYKLHPLLRDYSREQMPHARPSSRMVTFFVDYVVKHETDYAALDSEIGNLLGALNVAFEQGMKGALVRGSIALEEFLQARGLYEQAKRHLERAQEAAREINDLESLITLLHRWGWLAEKQGHYEQALKAYQEALILTRQTQNNKAGRLAHQQMSALLTSLGALVYRQGQLAQAKEYYDQGMSLAKQTEDKARMTALMTNLGLIAIRQGDYEKAEGQWTEALPLARQINNRKQLTITLLQNLGTLMEERGDYVQAETYLREGLALARQMGDPELKSRLLGNLGLLLCMSGNDAEASALFNEGLALAKKYGLTLQITRQLANLGQLFSKQRDYKQANLHYQRALKLARKSELPFDMCVILNQCGECHLAQGQLNEAKAVFGEALKISQNVVKVKQEEANSLFGLARLAAAHDNSQKARQLGEESLTIFAALAHQKVSELKSWLSSLHQIN